ncbi:MAG: SufD family Fe-S cluster assembly protein [Candidatus Aenigmatarchaeota archaeon]
MIDKIEELSKSNKEPLEILKYRKESWNRFLQTDMPKDDEWKYTDLSSIDFNKISFENSIEIKAEGCDVNKLDYNFLAKHLQPGKNKIESFNDALFSSSIIFFIPKNTNATIDLKMTRQNFAKIFFIVNGNAVVNELTAASDFTILQTEIFLSENASLQYNILDNSEKANIINEKKCHLNANSNVSFNFALFGGSVNRLKIENFIRENASGKIKGMFFGNSNQHFNISTSAIHLSQSSANDILIKGALKDYATSSYYGAIEITKEAQKADSYLADHVLLLSEEAKANSIPSLKIDANDVRATHGATVTELDEEQLFYLMSRGIDHKQSEYLTLNAFFNETMNNNKEIQKLLEKKMIK